MNIISCCTVLCRSLGVKTLKLDFLDHISCLSSTLNNTPFPAQLQALFYCRSDVSLNGFLGVDLHVCYLDCTSPILEVPLFITGEESSRIRIWCGVHTDQIYFIHHSKIMSAQEFTEYLLPVIYTCHSTGNVCTHTRTHTLL